MCFRNILFVKIYFEFIRMKKGQILTFCLQMYGMKSILSYFQQTGTFHSWVLFCSVKFLLKRSKFHQNWDQFPNCWMRYTTPPLAEVAKGKTFYNVELEGWNLCLPPWKPDPSCILLGGKCSVKRGSRRSSNDKQKFLMCTFFVCDPVKIKLLPLENKLYETRSNKVSNRQGWHNLHVQPKILMPVSWELPMSSLN